MKSYHRHWHMSKISRIRTHYQSQGGDFLWYFGWKVLKKCAHAFHGAELPVTHAHHIHLIITSTYSPSQHPEDLFQNKTRSPCITKDVFPPKNTKTLLSPPCFSVAKRTPSKQPVLEMDFSMVISNPFSMVKDYSPIGTANHLFPWMESLGFPQVRKSSSPPQRRPPWKFTPLK